MKDVKLQDNVRDFTGNRHAPTPGDWRSMEDFVESLLKLVKDKELNSLSWVATLSEHPERAMSDLIVLPGAYGHSMNSALSIQHRNFEECLYNFSPTGEESS